MTRSVPAFAAVSIALANIEHVMSVSGRPKRPNEHTFQAIAFLAPQMLSMFLDSGDPIIIRQEPSAERDRADIVVQFHGAAGMDVVEIKGPRQPIIGQRGRPLNSLRKAIEQVTNYKHLLSRTETRSGLPPLDSRTCRRVVIGFSECRQSAAEEATVVRRYLESELPSEAPSLGNSLVVASWQALLEKVLPRCEGRVGSLGGRLVVNGVAREVIANQIELWRSRLGQAACYGRLAGLIKQVEKETLDSNVVANGLVRNTGAASARQTKEVDARLSAAIAILAKIAIAAPSRCPVVTSPLLQLVDVALYQDAGDIAFGRWEHRSTHPVIALLNTRSALWDLASPGLGAALKADYGDDVVGFCSHMARYCPTIEALGLRSSVGARWRFDAPSMFLEKSQRKLFLQTAHMAYMMSCHKHPEATAFLNECATMANRRLIGDVVLWNKVHSSRDGRALRRELRSKGEVALTKERGVGVADADIWNSAMSKLSEK